AAGAARRRRARWRVGVRRWSAAAATAARAGRRRAAARGRQRMKRLAIIDDWGGMVRALPVWKRLDGRATIDAFQDTLADENALAKRLAPYEIVVPTRERTFFRAGLLGRLPALRMLAIGGRWTGQVDLAAAGAKGIVVTDTEGSGVNAFEHTIALMMALVRRVPQEDRATRGGAWQTPPIGVDMHGRTLGVIALGRIGGKMAACVTLRCMRVLATCLTLTDERAAAAGATRVDLDTLHRPSDILSAHARLAQPPRALLRSRPCHDASRCSSSSPCWHGPPTRAPPNRRRPCRVGCCRRLRPSPTAISPLSRPRRGPRSRTLANGRSAA